jgi:hypothetical protein
MAGVPLSVQVLFLMHGWLLSRYVFTENSIDLHKQSINCLCLQNSKTSEQELLNWRQISVFWSKFSDPILRI